MADTLTQDELLDLVAARNPQADRQTLRQKIKSDIAAGMPVNADGTLSLVTILRWNLSAWLNG